MADYGAVGRIGHMSSHQGTLGQPVPSLARKVVLPGETLVVGMGKATGQGSPAPLVIPCLGSFRFLVALTTSPQEIAIWAKQASNANPRPKMVVKANPEVGVGADQVVVAGAGVGWVEMTASVVFSGAGGAVWVELHNQQILPDPAYFGRLD